MTDAPQHWEWLEQAAQEAREIIDRLHGEASARLSHDRTNRQPGGTAEDRVVPTPYELATHEITPSAGGTTDAAEIGPPPGYPGDSTP